MPHQSFGTVRQGVERKPITFDFGLFGDETFTVVPDPSFGDTFDLYDAPEPTPDNMLASVRIVASFIRRMLAPEDRKRFDAALYRIPSTEYAMILDCAQWIAMQITPFESPPAGNSSGGRRNTGTSSKRSAAGKRR